MKRAALIAGAALLFVPRWCQTMTMKHFMAFALAVALLATGSPAHAQDDALSWDEIIMHGHRALGVGDVESALSSFRTANDMVQGQDDKVEEQIIALTSLGLFYATTGELVLAGDYHDQALALRLETYGEPSHQVAIGLRNLASVRQNQGLMAETSTLLNRALSNFEGIGDGQGEDALGVRRDLASVYYGMARYDDALEIYEDLLPAAEEGQPEQLVELLTSMAATHQAAERPALALPLLEWALEVSREQLPAPHSATAMVLNSLGEHLRIQGRSADALPAYQEALAMRAALHGETDPRVAPIMNNIGLALLDLGRLDEARTYLEAAYAIAVNAYGDRHPAVAIVMGNLADVLEAQGEFVDAVEANRYALGVMEVLNGPNHPEVARLRASLGRRLVTAGMFDHAAPELENARAVLEATYGHDHADIAEIINSQAEIARLSGEFELALELNAEASAILEVLDQEGTLDYADLLFVRATVYKTIRDMEAAAPLYAEVLLIRERLLGVGNPALVATLRDYAFVLRRLKRTEEATELEERATALEAE